MSYYLEMVKDMDDSQKLELVKNSCGIISG